jgi:transcriptional regulator with XRE-family HTH domain
MPDDSCSGARPDPSRRAELRDFLVSRRARIQPEDVGLAVNRGRRRTPGLRREEVAVLAGIGVSWYQWLEQGREITVSPQVLDSIARVLQLDHVEQRHMYLLAEVNPPPTADSGGVDGLGDALRRLIQTWMPYPAHILDRYWNTLACNDAARTALGFGDAPGNCVLTYFIDSGYHTTLNAEGGVAESIVAYFRAASAQYPDDDGFRSVVAEAVGASTEFAELWARGDVAGHATLIKEYIHPDIGALCFESTQLQVPGHADLTLVLHNPADNATRVKLIDLAGHGTSTHA